MIESYDPLIAPDPEDWLSADEQERLRLVEAYHRKAGVKLPNRTAHAVIHVVVENQAALGDDTAARETMERLAREGLDRHEAVHAVGSVLIGFMQAVIDGDGASEATEQYNQELETLTAVKWRKSFE